MSGGLQAVPYDASLPVTTSRGRPTNLAVGLEELERPMERAIPILPAEDLSVAKRFYVDALGFRVAFEASEDGRTGLLGVERGTIKLTLDSPMDGHGRNACVSLEVDDADAYYREWSGRVPVLRPPRDEDWDARTFDLLDPFGNTIFVMGPSRQTSP
jgi:catechol 2,3-dioxygenase-like lactoylglutathione lyase family enzyme